MAWNGTKIGERPYCGAIPTRPVFSKIKGTAMELFRPVGQQELDLIEKLGYRAFPPRLVGQPIFYPVLNKEYALEIATQWNLRDPASGFIGYILKFEIADEYIRRFDVQTVGAAYHQEYWIPAEELDTFNQNIVGRIAIVKTINKKLRYKID